MAAPSQKRDTNVQAYGADTTGMWTNLGVVECRKYKLVRLKKLTIRRSSPAQKYPRTQSMMKPKTRRLLKMKWDPTFAALVTKCSLAEYKC